MYKHPIILLLFLLVVVPLMAQPDTDIFLFRVMHNENGIALKEGVNATHRKGYDNQPFFFSEELVYYTAMTDSAKTDIFSLKVGKKKSKRITKTEESEYSPTPIPNSSFFSVIQVEADGTQRLWKFSNKGKGKPTVILPKIKPVGYHAWQGNDQIAMFVLGEPNTLQTATLSTEQTKELAQNVGRCFKPIPNAALVSFVHKEKENSWVIKSLNVATGEMKPLANTIEGVEDFAWLSDKVLLMGKGSKLYSFHVEDDIEWQEVGDLSLFGIYDFNRLAVSPKGNYLAVVATAFDKE